MLIIIFFVDYPKQQIYNSIKSSLWYFEMGPKMTQAKPLGKILCEKGYITQAQLEQALKHQIEEYQLLGELLVSLGVITEKQLGEALELQRSQPDANE